MSDRSAPICKVYTQPMHLLDKKEQRWYCYSDDILVINGVEVIWKHGRYRRVVAEPQRPSGMPPGLTVQSSDAIGRTHQETETASELGMIPCPKCSKENLSKAAYCEMCGSLIHTVKCPRCSETNRPWANFCIACDQSLDSTRIYD